MIEILEGEKSPYVLVNAEENKMIMKGNSFMANPSVFFEKVLEWSRSFKATSMFNIDITVGFYNTSTLKIMNMILKSICSSNEGKVSITMHVEEEDEDQINTATTIAFNVGVEPKIVYYT